MVESKPERRIPDRHAVIFLIHKDGSVLLEERLKEGSGYFGYRIIPGGGVDEDENPDQTMRRELREEMDIEPLEVTHLDTFEDMTLSGSHVLFDAYLVTQFSGEISNKEPQKCNHVWVPISEALDHLPLASSRLVIHLASEALSEEAAQGD